MSNLTDALIAAKLVGGSGGSGGGSGLPEIRTEPGTVSEKHRLQFGSQGGMYIAFDEGYSINEYAQLFVSWDDTDYICPVHLFNGMPLFGNLSIAGAGEDTGEPFLIAQDNSMIQIVTSSTASSHVVGIDALVQSPPNGVLLGVTSGAWGVVDPKANDVTVDITLDDDTDNVSYDGNYTYEEFADFLEAGKNVTLIDQDHHVYKRLDDNINFFYNFKVIDSGSSQRLHITAVVDKRYMTWDISNGN